MRLWIFAIESFGAQVSFDQGETTEDYDQTPVIVGYQFAESLSQAREQMAKDIAEERLDIQEPEFDREDESDEAIDAWFDYEQQLEDIQNELQFFELVNGGDHSTAFLS